MRSRSCRTSTWRASSCGLGVPIADLHFLETIRNSIAMGGSDAVPCRYRTTDRLIPSPRHRYCSVLPRRLHTQRQWRYYLGNRGYRMSKPSDLVQGTLDLLILKILALGPLHGWAVSQRLKQVSGNVLQVSDGSLYPALHKLEQEGWITAEWKTSELGRRAKYYSLTRLGRRQLEKEADNWGRLSSAISRVIKLKEA